MPRASFLAIASAVAFGFLPLSSHAQTTINILPAQNAYVGSFGVINTSVFGQTVTAPTTGVLQDFVFTVFDGGGTNIVVDAEVYAFDNSAKRTIGSALYQSPTFTITPNTSYVQYTAALNVPVVTGVQYLLLFTTAGLQGGQPFSSSNFGAVSPGIYAGGTSMFQNSGNDHSQITTQPFFTYPSNDLDLAFRADFIPAPEPSSVAALAVGALGLGALALRARRRSAA